MARQHSFIDKIDKYIGNKIQTLRLAKGISRQELANTIGVTHQQLQKYETGVNRVSAGRLLLIANALDKPTNYFYLGLEEGEEEFDITPHQRMCIEVSRNFMKLNNKAHQLAVNTLIKSLIKESA